MPERAVSSRGPIAGSGRMAAGVRQRGAAFSRPPAEAGLLDRVPDPVFRWDLDAERMDCCNRAWQPVLGQSPEEIESLGPGLPAALVHRDDFAMLEAAGHRVLARPRHAGHASRASGRAVMGGTAARAGDRRWLLSTARLLCQPSPAREGWHPLQDSNLRPLAPEASALFAELRGPRSPDYTAHGRPAPVNRPRPGGGPGRRRKTPCMAHEGRGIMVLRVSGVRPGAVSFEPRGSRFGCLCRHLRGEGRSDEWPLLTSACATAATSGSP
jgi:hypothetical protein